MSNRTCNVDKCNKPGTALGMCNLHYQRYINGRPLVQEAKPVYAYCTVDGCTLPTRSKHASMCMKHYHRQYRHGNADAVATRSNISVSHGRRYKTKYNPRHPLASKHGIVYVHRMVLFDAIGYGPHPCHWCKTPVNWGPKGSPDELQPDHLNGYGDDNEIDNLVPSCRSCNIARAGQARSAALRQAGWWSEHDTIAALRTQSRKSKVEDN